MKKQKSQLDSPHQIGLSALSRVILIVFHCCPWVENNISPPPRIPKIGPLCPCGSTTSGAIVKLGSWLDSLLWTEHVKWTKLTVVLYSGWYSWVFSDEQMIVEIVLILFYPYLPRKSNGFPHLTLVFTHKLKLVEIKIQRVSTHLANCLPGIPTTFTINQVDRWKGYIKISVAINFQMVWMVGCGVIRWWSLVVFAIGLGELSRVTYWKMRKSEVFSIIPQQPVVIWQIRGDSGIQHVK